MGKISLVAALLLCLLAFANANTFSVTVAVTEDNIDNPQSCQEQIQSQKLNHCRMYISRSHQHFNDELSMVTDDDHEINQAQEHLQQCCQELRNMDTQCRCPALKKMVMQDCGRQGEEAQRMLGKARYIPRMCNIQPTQCSF
ncbi:2S sulfur-rich seed storage protein 1-like [Solanum stenotomum]|uniref:2S sulfur-rich seed storage protein 1-like n=1 Tax=Solanum stenotomum TaxID=172797 RepID=UPI0020D0655E|nr:2S sulfur-rich seed storage protein 1-like [Solanum stenotomum]